MGTRSRLALMMALAYGVQGAWWPALAVHLHGLGIDERGRGWIFATIALAALFTPPLAGRIADRWLSAQKLMAILYAAGTVLLGLVALGYGRTLGVLFPIFFIYWMLLIPYLSLVATIALRNLANPQEEFGSVRLWGTIGWMTAGWIVSGTMVVGGFGTHTPFAIAAMLSAVLAVVSLKLPDTPPLATQSRGIAFNEVVDLMRRPGVFVIYLAGLLVSLTTPFIYQAVPVYLVNHAGLAKAKVAWTMTLGQPTEILALSFLPLVLDRLGRKRTLLLGIVAWIAYHGLFATLPSLPLALLALPLNGIAIAFFHVVAPIALDEQAPAEHRAGVQGFWVMTTSGIGSLIGGLLAGEVMQAAGRNWRLVFAVPITAAVSALILVAVAYRSRKPAKVYLEEIVDLSAVRGPSVRPCGQGVGR